MGIVKQDRKTIFRKLGHAEPFAAKLSLYTRTEGKEDVKEYLFFKTGRNKAITVDQKTIVHFLPNSEVEICIIEKKKHAA